MVSRAHSRRTARPTSRASSDGHRFHIDLGQHSLVANRHRIRTWLQRAPRSSRAIHRITATVPRHTTCPDPMTTQNYWQARLQK